LSHIFPHTSQNVCVAILLHNFPCEKNARLTVPIILEKKLAYTSHCKELVWPAADADMMALSTKRAVSLVVRPLPVAIAILQHRCCRGYLNPQLEPHSSNLVNINGERTHLVSGHTTIPSPTVKNNARL